MDFYHLIFAYTAVTNGSQGEGLRASLSPIAVLHIPHSSRQVPAEERQNIRLDDAALKSELLRMTDAFTDELFPLTPVEAGRVIFSVSRLVCDVERFPSDGDKPMAARGMGAIYTRTSRGEVLRAQLDAESRQTLLDHWYRPHHVTPERMVNDVIARSEICLIVDCHSFCPLLCPTNRTKRHLDRIFVSVPIHSIHLRRSSMRSSWQFRPRDIPSLLTRHLAVLWSRSHRTGRTAASCP
jgi:hypothetical protein